jgi:hypothetical protein
MAAIWEFANYHFNPLPVMGEILRIFPDGLIWGIGFFSLITLSYPFVMLFIALVESLLLYHGLNKLNTYMGIIPYDASDKSISSSHCKVGFTDFTLQSLSLFKVHKGLPFPSAPIYIFSVAMSYILSVMIIFRKDLESLTIDYSSRLYVSILGLSLFTLFLIIFRTYYKCDTMLNSIITAMVGFIIGAVLVQQNIALFDKNGINILGIPVLYNRTAEGSPLYVCNQPTT